MFCQTTSKDRKRPGCFSTTRQPASACGSKALSTITLLGEEPELSKDDKKVDHRSQAAINLGRQIFRFDTFGDEAWWGDTLKLHQAIAGARNGGVGPGVSPKTALAVGLKVDADALPGHLKSQIRAGRVNLDDPATTLALLKLNAVVGVTGIFDGAGNIKSMGVQCALCHSTVDDSFAPGIGKRLEVGPTAT